jgi:hypothetical protein
MAHSLSYRRILTRMGYYNYQNGLIYRFLNQENGWESHLWNCRRLILKALDLYSPEKVTVLGSGWLLDLPFAEMVERTKRICLIDIVHPPDVIKQVEGYNNVELIEQDITGGLIEQIWNKTGEYGLFNRIRSLENISYTGFNQDEDPGMVISLNILTQLELLLVNFLNKRSKIKEEEINTFRIEIQKHHLDFLLKHRSVLISDYAEVITSRKGSVKTITTLLTDLPPFQFREEWNWNFDHKGTDLYNSRSQFKVVGLIN